MAQYERADLEPIYSAIGEFVVDFQWVCFLMRFCYLNLFKRCGLQTHLPADVLLYSKELSDNVMNDAFEAAYCGIFQDQETRRTVRAIHKMFKGLIESRNTIVHGYWIIDEGVVVFSDVLPDEHGHRSKRHREGVKHDPLPTVAEIEKLSQTRIPQMG